MTVKIRNRCFTEDLQTNAVYRKHLFTLDSTGNSYLLWGTKDTVSIQSCEKAGSITTRDMTDYVVSDYKERIKAGEIINNPCTKTVQWTENCPCSQEYGYYKYQPVQNCYPPCPDAPIYKRGQTYEGQVRSSNYLGDPTNPLTWTVGFPTVDESQDFIDEMVTKAYAKVDTSEVSALVSVGEARETIKFLYDSGLRLLKLYRALRSLNFKALRSEMNVKEFSKRYLEYRYALNPLVSEMDQYFRMVFVGKSYPLRQTYRVYDEQTCSNIGQPFICFNMPVGTATAIEEASIKYVVRAGVLCDIDLEKLDRWGTKNLAQAALDLVPLSFIADWFFNISQTLAAHLPHAGAKQRASWYSVSKVETREKRIIATTRKNTLTVSGVVYDHVLNSFENCCIRSVKETYVRAANPSLRTFPQFTVKLNGWKLLDIGLILKQLITIPPKQTYVKRRKLTTIQMDNKTLVW